VRSGPLSSRRYFPKRTSTQRFDEAPKLDGGLGSGTVPVIAIPLAFRRTASRALEATNGPAVQSLTWISPRHGSIFAGKKIETEPRLVLKFWEMENGKVRRASLRSTREIQTR